MKRDSKGRFSKKDAETISYKATDKNMQCRGFQYSMNKEYNAENDISLCTNGFHSCEFPLDVLNYYPFDSRFFIIKNLGDIKKGDDKIVSSKIKFEMEINVSKLFKISFEKIKNICKKTKKTNTSGDRSHANTSGDQSHANTSGNDSHANTSGNDSHANTSGYNSHANTSGYNSHANTSGNYSHANTSGNESHTNASGYESIACSLGISSKSKVDNKTGWIIVVNWIFDESWKIKEIVSCKCGEEIYNTEIKTGYWYWFENGIFMEEKA